MNPPKAAFRSASSDSESSSSWKKFSGRMFGGQKKSSEESDSRLDILSPRFFKLEDDRYRTEVDRLISQIDGLHEAGRQLAANIQEKFKNLIDSSTEKPLPNAACDLWRMILEMRIVQSSKTEQKCIQEYHPGVLNDPQERNRRFLRLLGCFWEGRNFFMTLPDKVDWATVEDVEKCVENWTELNKTPAMHPIPRFIRSWSQERFNGKFENPVYSNFGLVLDGTLPSILAQDDHDSGKKITCTFFENGTHMETLELPIKIVDRKTREAVTCVIWQLRFHYDAYCSLTLVQTSGSRWVQV